MKTIFTFIFLVFFSLIVRSQTLTTQYLDKNRVKAMINKTNDRFWDIYNSGAPKYEAPRGGSVHAQFGNSIWIGGLDDNNKLHLCANTYKQIGTDYFSGPLDTTNTTVFTNSFIAQYNRVWKVDCNDIYAFANACNNGSVAANTYTIPEAFIHYPAQGSGKYMHTMEPFHDANLDGIYDPHNGDYPLIKGHQQILSIYNDGQSAHTETGARALGLEIHERSYAYYEPTIADSLKIINFTTFYEYAVYNRSDTNYHDVYVTDWADADLGYFLDDYIGCDTANNFGYSYNASNYDPTAMGVYGYGNKPPVVSHAMLDCPSCASDGIDNNHNNQIDEPGEKFNMDMFTYYNNNMGNVPPATTNPSGNWRYYDFMSGRWNDSTRFRYGGTAYNPTATVNSNWVYTGNPQHNLGWTENTAGNVGGDRRFLMGSGPFNLPSKKSFVFRYAIVFSQDTNSAVNTITQFNTRVREDIEHVRYYEQTHYGPQCAPTVTPPNQTSVKEQAPDLMAMAYPNPASSNLTVDLNQNAAGAVVKLYDVMGRIVRQETIKDGYRTQLNVTNLNSGIYILEVNCDNKKYISKIVKN
jgi:hypothetical protein